MRKHISELDKFLTITPISRDYNLTTFNSKYLEYTEFLLKYALELENKNISKTHLLINQDNNDIIGYLTLLTGSISLTDNEKSKHNVPLFSSFPCLKIGKLCVDEQYNNLYKGIGTLLLNLSLGFITEINNSGVACRFIIVDADIENNPTITQFYERFGFRINEKIKKSLKTVSMRYDIFI